MAPKAKMHWDLIVKVFILRYLVAYAAGECPEKCGLMDVSYPFWIHNQTCGYPGFKINCRAKVNNSKDTPFLPTLVGDFEILEINYSGYIIIDSTSLKAMSCNQTDDAFMTFGLPTRGPFTISALNRFAVIGCKSMGSYTTNMWKSTWTMVGGGCESACLDQYHPSYSNGYGGCEVGILEKMKSINFTGGGQSFGDGCGFSTILEPATFRVQQKEIGLFGRGRYGLRLEWGVGHMNCSAAYGTSDYSCQVTAECKDSTTGEGHVCTCHPIHDYMYRYGLYNAFCRRPYNVGCEGNGYSNGTDYILFQDTNYTNYMYLGRRSKFKVFFSNLWSKLIGFFSNLGSFFRSATGTGIIGSLSSIVVLCALFWWLKRRHKKHAHVKYFQQNGGLKLQQYIVSRGGRATLKIYSATELEKASKNYSTDMKLGSGGYGTVFKAIFPDGTVGAIKKSKQISDSQQEDAQFINELIILSQINHRNVVKLLGCCLETQNPLLVYEFVSNGTLRERIHSKKDLRWEIRLRIAIETAEALAYLHSAASQPIFHRDVKSSNILLDHTYTPKVADFGISRLLNADDTHLTTNVAGTMGYMDPEYFQTYQLTDKSDVYSFGVVLVELLTGLQPLSHERPTDECALSGLFLSRLNGDSLHEILDVSVMNEENGMQMKNIASLARECLHVEGRRRPSMKEVVEELVWIRGANRCREPYPSDEMQMQRETSARAQTETQTLVLEGCVASMSFSIGGR